MRTESSTTIIAKPVRKTKGVITDIKEIPATNLGQIMNSNKRLNSKDIGKAGIVCSKTTSISIRFSPFLKS